MVVTVVVDVVEIVLLQLLCGFRVAGGAEQSQRGRNEVEVTVIVAVVDRPCNSHSQHQIQPGTLTVCCDLL